MNLTKAIENNDYDTFVSLIDAGHDVNLGGWNHNIQGYPVYQATVNADKRYLQVLLEHGVNYNVSTCCCGSSYYIIHFACQYDRPESLKLLLSSGDNVNKLTDYDVTPLMLACRHGSIECVKVLMAHGADLYLTSKDIGYNSDYDIESTCMNFAIYYEQLEVVQTLFENGFELSEHENSICKCLVYNPNEEIFKYLMSKLDKYTLLAEVGAVDNENLFEIMLNSELFQIDDEEEKIAETLIDADAGNCIYLFLESHYCTYTYYDDIIKHAFNSKSKGIIEVLMEKGCKI